MEDRTEATQAPIEPRAGLKKDGFEEDGFETGAFGALASGVAEAMLIVGSSDIIAVKRPAQPC